MDFDHPKVMNLVIVHYHLKRGGVTNVIANQLQSLDSKETCVGNVLLLNGPNDSGWNAELDARFANFRFERMLCPEFGYEASVEEFKPDLAKSIVDRLDEKDFAPHETVIQIHNHGLGKNNSITAAVSSLAEAGYSLLLQIHDFAEDFRPENFGFINVAAESKKKTFQQFVYPISPRIHYGCLNRRDFDALLDSGIPESHVHFLPNPISVSSSVPSPKSSHVISSPDLNSGKHEMQNAEDPLNKTEVIRKAIGVNENQRFVLFPVRAIRRKNIGEAILFAAANDDVHVAITLPAVSPAEKKSYDDFVQFCVEQTVCVSFECGMMEFEFHDLVDAADFIFTSSVTEGFGMAFLESWFFGKTIVGRNLPEITADFVESGLELSHMYEQVRIPTNWFDVEAEIESFANAFESVCYSYARPNANRREIEKLFDLDRVDSGRVDSGHGDSDIGDSSCVDFAILSTNTQRSIIKLVLNDHQLRQEFLAINPMFTLPETNETLIKKNAQVVKANYSTEHFGKTFARVLGSTMIQTEGETVSAGNVTPSQRSECAKDVLTAFLDSSRFFPLRVE